MITGEHTSHAEMLSKHLLHVFIMQHSRLWRCINQDPCPQGAHNLVEEEDV